MKKYTRIIALIALLLPVSTFAQSTDVAVPEFKNKVMYVKKDNTLIDLDNTDLQTEMKAKLTGAGALNIKASGPASSVKRVGSPENKFIVKIDGDTDPESAVELFKFDADKKNRKITVAGYRMGSAIDVTLPKQKITFTKVQPGVWMISPVQQLEAGEYVFIINRPNIDYASASSPKNIKGFCFYVAAD